MAASAPDPRAVPPPEADRVLPATRWASLVVTCILVPALLVLWGAPGRTADLWAWTISPDLTPIFMGAGYGAGAYFFWRTFRARRWHPSSAGVFAASIFAALMMIATLLHWDRFNHGDGPLLAAVAFFAWTGVYIVSPFAVMWLWLRNRRTDPGVPQAGDAVVPIKVRLLARLFAAGALAGGGLFFVSPEAGADIWPWELTALTARVLACFMIQVGIGAALVSLDARWSAWRLLVQTYFVAAALLLVGTARAWSDFEQGSPMTWIYVGGLIATCAALLLMYRRLESSGIPRPGRP